MNWIKTLSKHCGHWKRRHRHSARSNTETAPDTEALLPALSLSPVDEGEGEGEGGAVTTGCRGCERIRDNILM